MRLIRKDLGFNGLIISVNLDSPATALGRSVQERAVNALEAGVDLLLVGLPSVALDTAKAITQAVEDGRFPVLALRTRLDVFAPLRKAKFDLIWRERLSTSKTP